MSAEVWILGGTGRSGRAVAAELARRGVPTVLVGRDESRLAAAAGPGGARTVVAASLDDAAAQIRRQRPEVVVNTIGPFTATAGVVADACPGHYLDLANDVAAVGATLARHDAAVAAGRTLITGAGFGVTATESVVVKLCEGRPRPLRVRVDMVPSIAMEAGVLGDALAATILDGLPGVEGGGRFQGRRIVDGRLAPARVGGDPMRLTLPDGTGVTTASMPLGELLAAQRASGARHVVAASSEVPSGGVARALMPVVLPLLNWRALREFARRRLAAVRVAAAGRPREHSWGHAVVTWADGEVREGWLRLGDAQDVTGAVPAEAAGRLLAGAGRPGAYTPAALFGAELAEACGGSYLLPVS
ncbi:saccharopine dehydrogenase NADP-binding domain-containing protein [Actinoplanes rectilineatus]|uniref:saccharopine dehydrogenase NADP-binding domain-containing protein n=1 Tax=Actinoplanes rectilineatus TaxID=113571 RepID=UPI0005F2D662|nr:saccharopine dehydrogenase NADP-binding domain-containing protein [Actinoplanes rectilineatus]